MLLSWETYAVMDHDECKAHTSAETTCTSSERPILAPATSDSGMQETLHLLSTKANAKRLRKSIANLRAGKLLMFGIRKPGHT